MKEIAAALGISATAVKARILPSPTENAARTGPVLHQESGATEEMRFGTPGNWKSNGRELRAALS